MNFLSIRNAMLIFLLLTSHFCFSAEILGKSDFLKNLEVLENAKLISTPEQDHSELIQAFQSAKKSIYVGIFGISSEKIAQALIDAQNRNVAVTVLCDKYCSNNPKRLAIYNKLKDNKVNIITTSAAFSISHWKSFLIDEQLAFISTMNFIVRTEQIRDIGLFVTNQSIIQEMLKVYQADIMNAAQQTNTTPALSQPNLVWSPINSEEKLTSLIQSARQSIDIWIENLGAKNIHQSLKNAAAKGIKVRILTSLCGMGMPAPAAFQNLKDLADSQVVVQVMPFPATTEIPYIHAKMINVDHENLFLGSENFSNNSLNKSRELGIIFQNSQIENQIRQLFEKDWKQSEVLPQSAPEKCSPLLGIAS